MIVLGIESSCDETAAAVLGKEGKLLSNVVASQAQIHAPYGGVVPEIASRKHMEVVVPVVCQALDDAGLSIDEIEGVAVTCGPGLIGSLLVGLSFAKAIAFAKKLPFVGVNHLAGHVGAIFLTEEPPQFPFIALVVSGGHTTIHKVEGFGRFALLGQTRDDAAGEAFDKAAKLLGIGYPGGVVIERLAANGNCKAVPFPRGMKEGFDFSFSGLKTSLMIKIKKEGVPNDANAMADIAASYQEAIVDVLVEKTLRAAVCLSIPRIVICGGVAANRRLRERFQKDASQLGIRIFSPPIGLCTDNAAMIALVGRELLLAGYGDPYDLNAVSRWPLAS